MKSFFVFDVESIGLHGEDFAVGGGLYLENGAAQWEFRFSCPRETAWGVSDDREWVKNNIPEIEITHSNPVALRTAFWEKWQQAKHQGAVMAAECAWPVEAGFLMSCIRDVPYGGRTGPYPLHDIASMMLAAGMDPMATYEREPSELPKHDPLADARQSARLMVQALDACVRMKEYTDHLQAMEDAR